MTLRNLFIGLGLLAGLSAFPLLSASAEPARARAGRSMTVAPKTPRATGMTTPRAAEPGKPAEAGAVPNSEAVSSKTLMKAKYMARPDLVVQIAKPASTNAPMHFQFANFGQAPANAFKIHVKLEYACEVGKLIHLADQKTFHFTGLGVGGVQSGTWTPASGFGAAGCYNRVRMEIDSTGIVFESNENNNVDHGHWCYSGSCY